MTPPNPRLVEDLIALGERALKRSRPSEHAAIEIAVLWLLERARELREGACLNGPRQGA